ncbi:MAG: EthD family reductase [Gammaproteobacteria bacterium]|nr:EthD family reductase [Gammaproteobacteria bacterium]
MSIIYLLEVHCTTDEASLSSDQIDELEKCLRTIPEFSELYLFTQAAGGHDPFLKDEHPPILVIQAICENEEALKKAISSLAFENIRQQLLSLPFAGLKLLQEVMLLESYLSSPTKKGLADLSYLVNYQRPAEDEVAFLQYYRDHHPAILLEFPNIRRLLLGTPIEWTASNSIERANRMLFCEVSFDNIESLNKALNSDVRKTLRKDYDCFPPFSGEVTHFPMHRKAIL